MITEHLEDADNLELEPAQESRLKMAPPISHQSAAQLKAVMRTLSIGLHDPIRSRLWSELAALQNRLTTAEEYDDQFDDLLVNKLPTFVDPTVARFFALNPKECRHVGTILWNLSYSYPQITFAPLLYPLVSLFLHFHTPKDTFRSMAALLSSRDPRFISINRVDKARDAFILIKLTNKFGLFRRRKFCASVRDKLKRNQLDEAFAEWVQWIFLALPFHYCVRIVDCFLVEGEKFLYRVALALALLYDRTHHQAFTLESMREFCENIRKVITPSQLIAKATKLSRISRKDISHARTKAEVKGDCISLPDSPAVHRHDMIILENIVFATRIAPRKFKSAILNWNQLDIIWEWIPERVYILEPYTVFYSDENGNSLQTFYSLCSDNEPTILIVKTLSNEIFGAYCSAPWSRRFDSTQYFGNGETFLFSIVPKVAKFDWVGKHRDASDLTHSQQLFMSATNTSFSVGAGGGIGLYIDENLARGETNYCETFENEPLTSSQTYFDISVIEVIAFA